MPSRGERVRPITRYGGLLRFKYNSHVSVLPSHLGGTLNFYFQPVHGIAEVGVTQDFKR